MIIDSLKALFERDLQRLYEEISLYKDEKKLWHVEQNIANSAGNLCLHLIGNLNTYIGAEIGGSGYIRNREAEFSDKNIPRQSLLEEIAKTRTQVSNALGTLKESELHEEYPRLVFEKSMSTLYFLMHLTTHLNYHLGQINYHRRLLDEK
ncbi:DUF1572 family protein [Olivibacter sp. CPCC 100613]|uniref:DinB family protein n=1 Tax=Olivibacter sp. CPCC 100613 TaxID=3079931 RepID=UPI002FF58611